MLEVSTNAFSSVVVIEMLGCVGAGAVCDAVATCDEDGSSVVEFEVLCDESSCRSHRAAMDWRAGRARASTGH